MRSTQKLYKIILLIFEHVNYLASFAKLGCYYKCFTTLSLKAGGE